MTSHPRVLMVGPAPPPPGGVASVTQSIVESDLAKRYEFVRFARNPSGARGRGVALRLFNAALCRTFGFDGFVSLETRERLAAYRATLRGLDPPPDLAHIHCACGYDYWLGVAMVREARRHGIPSLLHTHGIWDVRVPSWSRAKQAVFRRTLRMPDRVAVLSESWLRWFAQQVDAARLVVLRNPVDVGRFRPRDGSREDGLVRLLFVGAYDPELKGAYDILAVAPEVVREAPNVRFVFVGNDVDRLEERFVRGTPLAPYFEFAGSKDAGEMVACFGRADVLLLPSHGEGLPIALLEGMAASLPIVSCPVGGIPEAMHDPENGILIAPGDRPALARAILDLVSDPERRRRIGAANRGIAERQFDIAHYVRVLGEVYEDLLARRGSTRAAWR